MDWLHRPKLEFVDSIELLITVRFRVGKDLVEKKVGVLQLSIGNTGKLPSANPMVTARAKTDKDESKKRWVGRIPLQKEIGDADYVPVPTFSLERTEEELSIALLKRGFPTIKSIEGRDSNRFIFAFAFEGSDHFFLGGSYMLPIPFDSGIFAEFMVGAHGTNRFQSAFYDTTFLLEAYSWDRMKLTKVKG